MPMNVISALRVPEGLGSSASHTKRNEGQILRVVVIESYLTMRQGKFLCLHACQCLTTCNFA